MRVRSLHFRSFRGIHALDLELPQEARSVVLIGANGSGKTAVLDGAAVLLSRLEARIFSPSAKGRQFTADDISTLRQRTENAITVAVNGTEARWSGSRGFQTSLFDTPLPHGAAGESDLGELATKIRGRLEADETAAIPLMVYYPVNRAVLDIPLRVRKTHDFDQSAAYSQALDGGSANFRIFFEWFRRREDIENEHRTDDGNFRDPQLQAVRTAVAALIPGFDQLRVRRENPLRMTVRKQGEEISIQQLSDGEKCLLAMTGDLARRLAIANPSLDDPLQGEGVVLIDEIELHLHPAWQRRVIPALERTFPNCQFLITTHSPAVLGHIRRDAVFLLDRAERGKVEAHQLTTLGQDANRILEDVFGVPERPQEFLDRIHDLFTKIDESELEKARVLADELRRELGPGEPKLIKADAWIRRKEMLGR